MPTLHAESGSGPAEDQRVQPSAGIVLDFGVPAQEGFRDWPPELLG